MNKFENWFCGSAVWRFVTERKTVAMVLSGYAWEITSWKSARGQERRPQNCSGARDGSRAWNTIHRM